jgi:hypothetical protein
MKNPATNATKDDFNVFTEFLFKEIKAGKKPLVELRDGRVIPLSWFDEEGPEYEHFVFRNNEKNIYLIWENDGHSITSQSFDIMGLYEG